FYVEASGTPYEIGRQLGEATRLAIGNSLDMLAARFRHTDETWFRDMRDRHMAYTERRAPELIEEAQGIADGSGVDFRWIYLASFYASMRRGLEGCSNLIFTRSPDGPILARTCDLPAHEGKHAGLALVRPEGGLAVLASYWPGTTWRGSGINEAGLAVGGSSCGASVPMPEEYMNPHALPTVVLAGAESVSEAIALMSEMPAMPWGANHALVDASGDAAIVEKAGAHQAVRRTEDGRLWCTNHSVTEELSRFVIDDEEKLRESRQRFDAIGRLSARGQPGVELAREVVSYTGRPGAICRYADDDPRGNQTEWAFIARPGAGELEACFSHPDRDPWHSFAL
ncbi:MAG: C45 family autoproteolytic acyltransferase/hydrolase, partial [Armatimonadota bacterium]